ncbi:MAG: DNA mismatch repair endonuclease MutL [bacterium]|nr:DNA mismatch repair endonuclease MutL [bacterium]
MGKIAVLPPVVQGQIAAGEVVERPASVVKELVENALDAGATRVDVSLRQGGVDRIVVRDDGEGMLPDDAVLAFSRHATSKLTRAEDLPGVPTLGFRGEALPSIASAGRVRLVTRPASEAAAIVVEADGHGARLAGPTGAAPGTTVEVHDLFAATPARRKFLRTAATEVGHVVDLLTRLAVACPTTGFRLEHDGREVVAYPPVQTLRQRLAQVLGAERAAGMVEAEGIREGVAVRAFLASPRESLATARLVWTFVALAGGTERGVARRWVRDRLLLRAVLDGYESLLMRGRYPVAMVFVATPPGECDVNVHPAKLEVRFRRPALVHQLVVSSLRSALTTALKEGATVDVVAAATAREVAPAYVPAPPPVTVEPADVGVAAPAAPSATASPWTRPAPAALSTAGGQGTLWQAAPEGFAALRFVGQVFEGYLLCEGRGRVVLIDQHAAHERVRFERLRRQHAAGNVERDPLLVPETVTLPRLQVALLGEHQAVLAAAGMEGEPFGADTFLLRTIPRLLRGKDVGTLVRAIADELASEGASGAAARALDGVLATLACHSAVRVGQGLAPGQVRALLEAMDTVDVNAHCPHGRPVAVELTRVQVESLFGR